LVVKSMLFVNLKRAENYNIVVSNGLR